MEKITFDLPQTEANNFYAALGRRLASGAVKVESGQSALAATINSFLLDLTPKGPTTTTMPTTPAPLTPTQAKK